MKRLANTNNFTQDPVPTKRSAAESKYERFAELPES